MWFVLILCIIAAFADVLGGALTIIKPLSEKEMAVVTALGAGFLLGATVLDRLPDAMNELPTMAPLYIVVGYLALLVLQRFGAHQHQHVHSGHADAVALDAKSALVSLVGLSVHTFMDGVVIAGAFAMSRSAGVLMFIAITLHKIPEGFSMATISLASGTTRRRALMTSVILALSTLLGACITLGIGNVGGSVVKVLMALATGTFLFISTTDLMPVVRDQQKSAIFATVFGVAVFYMSLLLVKHVGLS